MMRVTSRRTRQALLTQGTIIDPTLLPDELQLFNEDGEPLSLGGGYRRDEASFETGILGSGISESGVFQVAPSWRAFKMVTSRPARVRVYPMAAYRDADAPRNIGTVPHGDHGRLLEVVTYSGVLSLVLSPAVDFTSDDADQLPDFYYHVTNLDIAAGTVLTTFDYVRTE